MVSIGWVVGALLAGGYAGMLVFALMSMAVREGEQTVRAQEFDGFCPVDREVHANAE